MRLAEMPGLMPVLYVNSTLSPDLIRMSAGMFLGYVIPAS